MPMYDVVNKKTGEKKTLHLSIDDYVKWKEENPDWDKNWEEMNLLVQYHNMFLRGIHGHPEHKEDGSRWRHYDGDAFGTPDSEFDN